jgi:hypothetical protein
MPKWPWKYTDEEIAFIRERYKGMGDKKLIRQFFERFGKNLSLKAMSHFRVRHGMKRSESQTYSDEEKTFLIENWDRMLWKELAEAFAKKFRPINSLTLRDLCVKRLGLNRAEGFEQIYVQNGFPRVLIKMPNNAFRVKANVVWEKVNGPLPKRYFGLLHLDGNTLNDEPENLALSFKYKVDQKRLNEEVGLGHPELAGAWLAIHNLENRINVRKRKLASAGKLATFNNS